MEYKIEQNNIIEVAQNAEEIVKKPCSCPKCNTTCYAAFDKLFVAAYGQCIDCTSAEELKEVSENIFAIIQVL